MREGRPGPGRKSRVSRGRQEGEGHSGSGREPLTRGSRRRLGVEKKSHSDND